MSSDLQVAFLDAGQGDCTLIKYPDGTLTLVDCGSVKNGGTTGPEIIEALQRYANDSANPNPGTIDNLVLTHPDKDHYNLVATVFSPETGLTIGQSILIGGVLPGTKPVAYSVGDIVPFLKAHRPLWQFPPNDFNVAPYVPLSRAGVEVYILAANCTGNYSDAMSNDNSIVLLVYYAGAKIFLMGDATAYTERGIINYCNSAGASSLLQNQRNTALKMGHHGSTTSSCEEWIKTIAPQTLFISTDTKAFGSTCTGLPARTHLNNVRSWTTLKSRCGAHEYIDWCDDRSSPDYGLYLSSGFTNEEVCSTLYKIVYDSDNSGRYKSTGGSWYYVVTSRGTVGFLFTGQK